MTAPEADPVRDLADSLHRLSAQGVRQPFPQEIPPEAFESRIRAAFLAEREAELPDLATALGELAGAREVLATILSDPYGCPMCDSGKLRNGAKDHWPECGFRMAEAALSGPAGRGGRVMASGWEMDLGGGRFIALVPSQDVNGEHGFLIRCRRPDDPGPEAPTCKEETRGGETVTWIGITTAAAAALEQLLLLGLRAPIASAAEEET